MSRRRAEAAAGRPHLSPGEAGGGLAAVAGTMGVSRAARSPAPSRQGPRDSAVEGPEPALPSSRPSTWELALSIALGPPVSLSGRDGESLARPRLFSPRARKAGGG